MRRPRRPAPRLALPALLALLLPTACMLPQPPERMPVAAWFADDLDLAPVRRIMVLPLQLEPVVEAEETMLREHLISELEKIGRFDVRELPEGASEHDAITAAVRSGTIRVDALVALGKRYGIDGVVLGTVTSYRPYQPPRLGMHLQLLSMHSGSIVWVTRAMYDSQDARVQEDLRHYARSFLAPEPSMHDWRLSMLSPRKYAAYVAHRLVGTWRQG